jgi:hypothetical protein
VRDVLHRVVFPQVVLNMPKKQFLFMVRDEGRGSPLDDFYVVAHLAHRASIQFLNRPLIITPLITMMNTVRICTFPLLR